MSDSIVSGDNTQALAPTTAQKTKPADKPAWETPRLEDVSEQVMAQPYIRFT
jgi:hypothetical protein